VLEYRRPVLNDAMATLVFLARMRADNMASVLTKVMIRYNVLIIGKMPSRMIRNR
jgi:hypothetical protein